MPTITDLKLANLATLGYTGNIDDAEFEYLGSLGYTGSLDDRRRQLYVNAGFTNELEYLRDKGYVGTLGDMQLAAFIDEAYYVPPEYVRQAWWYAMSRSSILRVPFGNAGMVYTEPFTVQVTYGTTTASTQFTVWSSIAGAFTNPWIRALDGSYNQTSGWSYQQGISAATISWTKPVAPSKNVDFWTFKWVIDVANTEGRGYYWKETAPETVYDSGVLSFTNPASLATATPDTHIQFNQSNGWTGMCCKDIYLWQSDTLVGHWPIDDGTGTTLADQSGNGNDGAVVSTLGTWVETAPYTTSQT